MKDFIYTETMPCWVTFTRIISATSLRAAEVAAKDGAGTLINTEIGDILDGYDINETLVEAE